MHPPGQSAICVVKVVSAGHAGFLAVFVDERGGMGSITGGEGGGSAGDTDCDGVHVSTSFLVGLCALLTYTIIKHNAPFVNTFLRKSFYHYNR